MLPDLQRVVRDGAKPKPNSIFFLAAAGAVILIGAAILLAASAVHRYRQRRAWKRVRAL